MIYNYTMFIAAQDYCDANITIGASIEIFKKLIFF